MLLLQIFVFQKMFRYNPPIPVVSYVRRQTGMRRAGVMHAGNIAGDGRLIESLLTPARLTPSAAMPV